MGIRMHRRRRPGGGFPARARAAPIGATPLSPVPAFAAGASTARIPADLAATVRGRAAGLRQRLTARTARTARAARTAWSGRTAPDRRAWADLARGHLALLVSLVPRARPRSTLTVFVAHLTAPPGAPGPHRPHHPDRPGPAGRPHPGPDAAP